MMSRPAIAPLVIAGMVSALRLRQGSNATVISVHLATVVKIFYVVQKIAVNTALKRSLTLHRKAVTASVNVTKGIPVFSVIILKNHFGGKSVKQIWTASLIHKYVTLS